MITSQNTKTIYDLVQNAGKEHGDHVFLRYEDNDMVRDVTYQQFADECNAISAWLTEQDEKAGHKVKVGLMGSSSHYYLAALLGIMGNGNVAVPLDTQLNVETLSDCLNRSDVDILFYDWEHYDLTEGAKENCPNVTEYIALQNRKRVSNIRTILKEYAGKSVTPSISEEDCAMILFTSGTTGQGKGVMLSNRNLIDNVFCTTDSGNPAEETYMNVLPIHHVFCLNGDVFLALRYGNVLCLNMEMSRLAAHIQLFQPSVIRMVPMMARSLYNRIVVLSKRDEKRPIDEVKEEVLGKKLHKIVCGGGYLAPELAENYRELGIAVAQGYGMSECSPKISAPDWDRPDKVSSVGRIVDGCQVRIVDGEIQVKSPSVMMGYYKDPEETAKSISEDGWLCTGDLGYVDEEGFLFFTGRKKNLIVLSNGENVAPEQLENLFVDEPLIEDILVFEENDTIAAEVYPNYKLVEAEDIEDVEAAIDELIKKHNETLPTFKRIMKCRVRENPFEKTSSKKIIRHHYFDQKKQEEETLSKVRKPENEVQQSIYDSVAANLGHRRFGIDTDFYEAGLDSMGSVMLLTDLYNKLEMSLTLSDLTANATVLKLESFLEKATEEEAVDYTKKEVYPLTNLQMYFAYVMRGNTTANLPFLFKLDESVDLDRLKKAVEDLLNVHPELKDIIKLDEGMFKNFRQDDRKVDIPIVTLSDTEWEKTKETLLVPYMYGEDGDLFHIGIYKTDSANYLFFDIAHIMGDGMTMNVLFEDLNALYSGKKLPQEKYTFYEYILDEKAKDAKGLRTKNEEYFMEQMKDFRIRKSILNRKESYDLDKGTNAAIKERLADTSKKKIRAFCKKHGVSENVMFLTAFNYCVSVFSDEKDTISTTIHSGRTDSRWNRLAGPLFITYYFRYKNVPHETVPQLLKRSAKQILNTMDCYVSNLHADEMFFQYQGDILEINQIGGAPAERQRIQLDSLPFHLQVFTDKKGYFYELRYWENRFDREQLVIFMQCMEIILNAMLEEPSVRRLRKHLPESLSPKHYFVKAGTVNKEAGGTLITNVDEDTEVKAYIMDSAYRKLPYGGWGDLYIMDHETKDYIDTIDNPYGDGILYHTGRTARILPDGSLDMLENGGRMIMSESLTGRNFLDLYKLEQTLLTYDGITDAEAFVQYAEGNKLVLTAQITSEKEISEEELNAYLEEKLGKALVPGKYVFG